MVKLTAVSEGVIWINQAQIVSVEAARTSTGSLIWTTAGRYYRVTESVMEVLAILGVHS